MSSSVDNNPKRDEESIRADERIRMIGLLLIGNSPNSLLCAPQFLPLEVTPVEIDAALARARKKRSSEPPEDYVVSDAARERIKNFRLLDDLFMREVLRDNIAGVQDIVRIILENPEINVVKVDVDESFSNVHGRGVRLDVLATDGEGKLYNIEIQRDSRGATPKRARFYHSAIDWNLFNAKKFDELAETWVIFITDKRYIR